MALACLVSTAAQAQTVTVYARTDSVRVGERFELVVRAEGRLLEPILPDTSRAFAGPDVVVFERIGGGTAYAGTRDPGVRVDSAIYRVAAFALDSLVIPPVAVGFVRGPDTVLVPSRPFALPMIATAPPDAEGLEPALGRMEVGWPWWAWLSGGLVVAALAGLAWWLLRRRPPQKPLPPAPPLTPAARALQRLDALGAVDLSDAEAVKPYYVELTDAVRTYLEATTAIPALESTSGEVLRRTRTLTKQHALPDGITEKLADVFAVADYAKFADGIPTREDGARSRMLAAEIVNRIEMHRAMHAPASPTPA